MFPVVAWPKEFTARMDDDKGEKLLKYTAIPQKMKEKCWPDHLNLSHDRHEKQTNQTNTLQLQHRAPDLQPYSTARGFQNSPRDGSGRSRAYLLALESRR